MTEYERKLPLWLRIFYLISGVLVLGFALVVFINLALAFIDDFLIMGITILVISVTRVLKGIFDNRQTKWFRYFTLTIGILLLPIGIVTVLGLTFDIFILFSVLSIAILLLGIVGIVQGFEDKKKVRPYRISIIFYGFILVALSITSLIFDVMLTDSSIIVILNTAIALIGLRRLFEGIAGHKILKQPTD